MPCLHCNIPGFTREFNGKEREGGGAGDGGGTCSDAFVSSRRLDIMEANKPGTMLLVTEMTPVAPWLCTASWASSSLPLQQAIPLSV